MVNFIRVPPRSYFTRTELHRRGWTIELIQRLLGEPDDVERKQATLVSGSDTKRVYLTYLYSIPRVYEAEDHPEFLRDHVGRRNRD